jgi:phage terminase large subunit-like protein
VIGRRGGKSQATAAYAVYLAAFGNYAGRLSHGEQAVVVLVAADRKQAKVLLGYCRGALEATPMMRQLIQSVTKEAITLTNGVTIEVHTGSFRRIRGRTAAAALCDEIGFWYSEESANPDAEVLVALRPALATARKQSPLALTPEYESVPSSGSIATSPSSTRVVAQVTQ